MKMRHWAGLKWLRVRDIRIKASAVGSCTNEMALALWTLFICLRLPSSPIMFGVGYIFMFSLTMRTKWGNDASAISRMPTNLHEQRIWLWWWTFSSRTLDSENIIPVEWIFILEIYVLPFLVYRATQLAFILKCTLNQHFSSLLFPIINLFNLAVCQPGRTMMCIQMRRAVKAHIWHFPQPQSVDISLFDTPGAFISTIQAN